MTATSSRMLALLSLLQARRQWPGALLAERLEVTPRTVRRDVDRLRELGYRVEAVKGPDGGYRLAAGSELPPLLFDEEQAVAIALALGTAAASGADIGEAAARALATIRQVMPSALRHRVDGLRFTADAGAARVDPRVLEAVSTAVRDRTVLRFGYRDEEAPPRRTEPHALLARQGYWYLVAWDLDRDDWRIFRLDRLTPRMPAGRVFTPRPLPMGDAQRFLAARFKGSETDRWPCVGEAVVHLPLHRVAPWIGDGDAEERADGASRVVLGSWSWAGLTARLLAFDAAFDIVGPPEFGEAAAMLRGRLRRAAGGQSGREGG